MATRRQPRRMDTWLSWAVCAAGRSLTRSGKLGGSAISPDSPFPAVSRRRFENLRSFPRGLVPIADVISRFNPLFGQGMSVAAQEATALSDLLRSRETSADPLDGLAEAFFQQIQPLLATPWSIAENDFIYPQTRGQRPHDIEGRLSLRGSVDAGSGAGSGGAQNNGRSKHVAEAAEHATRARNRQPRAGADGRAALRNAICQLARRSGP